MARIEAGWDAAAGSAAITVGATTVTVAAGTYCHTDISSVATGYTAFAAALKAAIDGATALTATVTWDGATPGYTLALSSTATIAFPSTDAGTHMKQILGFAGSRTTATSHVSDVRPYYVIVAENSGWSRASDDYEPEELTYGAVSDSGRIYSIGRTESVIYNDFTVPMERKAAVFDRWATSAVPYTWSHFFQTNRSHIPFLRVDAFDSSVHRLRFGGTAASFRPRRRVADWDDAWDIEIQSFNLGYL